MRDIFFAFLIFGSIPLILFRAWVGIPMWYWVGLMNPHRLSWGFMMTAPVAMAIALATLVALLFSKDRKPLPFTRETTLVILMTVHFTIVTFFFAWVPDAAFDGWETYIKIILITLVAPMLVYGKVKTLTVLAVVTLSIGYYGFKGGIHSFSTGFGGMVLGPPGTFIAGNTDIGLAMVMTLPLLLVLARQVHRGEFQVPVGQFLFDRWHRWLGLGVYGVFWLQVAAIVGTQSRGSWVALAVIFPFLFLSMRRKFTLVAIAVLVVGVVGVTVPDRIQNQIDSLIHHEEDTSAQGRIVAWEVNWNIAKEAPFTGSGFRTYYLPARVWLGYADDPGHLQKTLTAHSIYFQMLGNHGFLGLALYLAMILFTLMTLFRVNRQARRSPEATWMGDWSWALGLGVIGFLVGGAFLSRAYFDLFFAMVALAVVLRRELQDFSPVSAPGPANPVLAAPRQPQPAASSPKTPEDSISAPGINKPGNIMEGQ